MRATGKFLFCAVLAAIVVSCYHPEDFDMDKRASDPIHYDMAMPLVDAHLTLENIIDTKGGVFVPDETGLLHLVYTTELYEKKLLEDFTLDNHYIAIGESGIRYRRLDTVLAFTSRDSITVETRNLPSGIEIKRLYLNSVKLHFSVTNRFEDPLDWSVRFPNIKEASGSVIALQRRIGAHTTEEIDIDYPQICIEMEGSVPYVLREDEVQVDMRGMTQDSAWYSGGYNVQGSLSNLLFSRLEGYAGKVDFSFVDRLPVEGLGIERMEKIGFNEATINTDFWLKGVSAPVRIGQSVVEVYNRTGRNEVEVFPPDYDVPYPSIDKVPLQEETLIKTDIKDLVLDLPTRIAFSMQGTVNPDNDRSELQAVEKDASVSMTVACDVTAWFSADTYTLYDTVPISLVGDDTEINYFELKTIFKNAFPLDFSLDLIFLNRDRSPAFVLFKDRLVASAVPGPDFHVTTPTVQNFIDELDSEQVEAVRNAAYVVICAKLNTYQEGEVKIYMPSENEGFFNAKVGFRAKVEQKF